MAAVSDSSEEESFKKEIKENIAVQYGLGMEIMISPLRSEWYGWIFFL